jgi:hypothetical protein
LFKKSVVLLSFFLTVSAASGQTRSFADLFPGFSQEETERVFSREGITISSAKPAPLKVLSPALPNLDIGRFPEEKTPSFTVESLIVVPAEETVSLLDIYNNISRIRDLKGRVYHSHTKNAETALFEDATRIESARKLSAIPDPPPARTLPSSETLYIFLKDANFGNSYYRAGLEVKRPGIVYELRNFKSLSYLFIPVIRENKFFARFYLEPIAEGVLIYSVAGADVSDFVAKQVDMPSAIGKRLGVIQEWIIDGFSMGIPE